MPDYINFWKPNSLANAYNPVQDNMHHEEVPVQAKPATLHTQRRDLILTFGKNGNQVMVGDSDDPSTWQPAVEGRDFLTQMPPPVHFRDISAYEFFEPFFFPILVAIVLIVAFAFFCEKMKF